MIVITGAAGFIGSVLVGSLNLIGRKDLILVDNLGCSQKWQNLVGKSFIDYLSREQFLDLIKKRNTPPIEAIVHLGACSSTSERNVAYLMDNNFRYTLELFNFSQAERCRFIYASSAATYGNGSQGYNDDLESLSKLEPLNPYGFSKHATDLAIAALEGFTRCVGLKFFNVFGPNEAHKEGQHSVVYGAYQQIKATGKVRLFSSLNPNFKDGEQRRDFIYVKDCCQTIIWLLEHQEVCGLFNLGTGVAHTFNELVYCIFASLKLPLNIEYIDMPQYLRDNYQYHTQAQMKKLLSTGARNSFTPLQEAISDYILNYLEKSRRC